MVTSKSTLTSRTTRTGSTSGGPWSSTGGVDGVEEGYRPFFNWDLLNPQSEAELFAEFWEWFSGLRKKVTDAGLSFRAYCYNEAHENTQMRRCAAVVGLLDEVEDFIASERMGGPVEGIPAVTSSPATLSS